MKKLLFLFAMVLAVIATGCQSSADNSSNPLPDQGRGPAAPVGGGTMNQH